MLTRMTVCAALAAVLIGACQSSTRPRREPAQLAEAGDAVAAEPRIYAYSDRPLALPLAPARAPGMLETDPTTGRWRPARLPRVQYEGGVVANARLVYFEARPNGNAGAGWFPSPATWSVTDWTSAQEPSWNPASGFWALMIPPPPDGRRQVLRFNGSALPVIWLASPPATTDSLRAPRLDLDRAALRALGERLVAIAQDPLQAWRVRILTDRFRASELWANPPAPPPDPALAALADQLESRWRSAIAVFERDDPELATEFVARLTAVVRVPGGAALPAWGPEDSALNTVRAALLSPTGTRSGRIQSVRAWLGATPEAVAWVVEDSATEAPNAGETIRRAMVTVANLTSAPLVASSAPLGKPALNAARLPAHGSAEFICTVDGAPGSLSGAVIARAGGWSRTLPLLKIPLPVTPPGLLMGPLLARWDMISWLAGRPEAPDPRTACIALLQRSPTDAAQWEAYIECAGAGQGDVVTLWFGPFGAPANALRVGPGAAGGPPFHREGSRWWASVAIPSDAIEPGSHLLVGVTRQLDSGELWSWPRPMMPGQLEPARAIVDFSAWGSMVETSSGANESNPR